MASTRPSWQRPRPRRRTLGGFAVRFAVVRLLGFGALATTLALGSAMSVDTSGGAAARLLEDAFVPPGWTAADAAAHPGCVPLEEWPEGRFAPYVVVEQVRDGVRRKLSFDRAWRLNHDESTETDDVWVVGVCAPGEG